MPFYTARTAAAPLRSDVVTRERLERLLRLSNPRCIDRQAGIEVEIRHVAVEDDNGFFVPRSICFSHAGGHAPTFWLLILDDEIDARVCNSQPGPSPWSGTRVPDQEAIDAYWRPLTDPIAILDMEVLFVRVEAHMLSEMTSDLSDDAKLSVVPREVVDLRALAAFCAMLGRDTRETAAHVDDHVIFAAYDPRSYLRTRGCLGMMTLEECRLFSWRGLVRDGDSHFFARSFLCAVDWKADAGDIETAMRPVLDAVAPHAATGFHLKDDGTTFLASDWLEMAAALLAQKGLAIVQVDRAADTTVLTVIEADKAARLVRLGRKLGFDCAAIGAFAAERKGWFARLFR